MLVINYKDIAKVNRSPTTIRKWCSKITDLSGYTFTFDEVYQGRNKDPVKKPVFTKQDVSKFKQLVKRLDETNNFEHASL